MSKTDVFAALCVVAAMLAPQAAGAVHAAPRHDRPNRDIQNRYVMEKTADGIVRMDTATGAMTFCHEDKGKLSCAMPNDERTALEQRVDRLEGRVSKLETSLAALKGEGKPLPSDKDLDQAMNAFDRVMRHFFKMVQDFNKDLHNEPKKQDNSAAAPQRT
ncbi:MAG TPA: hypothetical protein VFJ18_15220 [Pararhizobium sp.]|nr:hypothetical protein [Pararhizobium sp.]